MDVQEISNFVPPEESEKAISTFPSHAKSGQSASKDAKIFTLKSDHEDNQQLSTIDVRKSVQVGLLNVVVCGPEMDPCAYFEGTFMLPLPLTDLWNIYVMEGNIHVRCSTIKINVKLLSQKQTGKGFLIFFLKFHYTVHDCRPSGW
jgi:hypothetical protein